MNDSCSLALLVALVAATLPRPVLAVSQPEALNDLGYFVGSWSCAGKFINGKPISADVNFKWALDGKWIVMRQQDHAPNTYGLVNWWGYDAATKQPFGILFDNKGTVRHYRLSGSIAKEIVMDNTSTTGYIDRFVFVKRAKDNYRVTYYRKNGKLWQEVDGSDCHRDAT